ncbi:ABC transporter ATP-binding protein [Paenisporosarcina cavernae]|uniref:ABC transporter ATP-binding protein n=1 Tax=Paenisporosarcina cavernae TaxID=2320858 RepID=A0A385YPQ1_9BACL|nr:ABC transporter ATP-binding protein [Paenisporosarcina cavernae]AYC28576.1 ABC transporter ATP-binding protein [Paenisporosarcina cavernae]
MEPIVELRNLSKTIGSKKIIKNLNLSLYPGQITGFLGPNGAGKTTTIRMMAGLMKPTSGEVWIEGQSNQTHFEETMQKMGVIVENPEMYKFMSGWKNLVHFARMHKGVDENRIREVVAQVGMEKRIHEKVSTYSLGMRQRLGLAQALLHRPKFLILDEPTNGLDPAGIREFRTYLRQIAEQDGVSVFVSSHLLSEIELMCDRIAVIQNGELIDIREMHQTTESFYYLQAEPSDALTAVLGNKVQDVTAHNKGYVLAITEAEVPSLISELVANGVAIYQIAPFKKTLEDQFLEMTGGGQIV